MKKTKTDIKFFPISKWKEEEEYLRKQHNNGWEFIKVSGFCKYCFKKCEPKDTIYQLDYNLGGMSKKRNYTQQFYNDGWEYLQDYMGYSYFRKAASEVNRTDEKILFGDAYCLDKMKRIIIGRKISIFLFLYFLFIPQIIQNNITNSFFRCISMLLLCVVLIAYLRVFLTFIIIFWKCHKSVYKK